MKKVKLNNKLQLNKETIAKLNNEKMNHLAGGQIGTILSLCKSCIDIYCGCPPPTQLFLCQHVLLQIVPYNEKND